MIERPDLLMNLFRNISKFCDPILLILRQNQILFFMYGFNHLMGPGGASKKTMDPFFVRRREWLKRNATFYQERQLGRPMKELFLSLLPTSFLKIRA